MASYEIRWKRGDYVRLGRAISQFNKKVNELETLENKLNLPELEDYKSKKERIKTRQELERYIKSLQRFNKPSQQEPVYLESGEALTKWEYSELKKARKRIERNLELEMIELNEPMKGSKYSRVQMGSQEARVINRELERLKKLDKLKGYEFKELRKSIFRRGTSDFEFRLQIQYKENFLNMLEEFKSYKGYDQFKEKIKNLNPKEFYEFISQEKDLAEIKYYYNVKNGSVVPDGLSSEEMFINIIGRLGVKV